MSLFGPYLRQLNGVYAHWCQGCEEMHAIPVGDPYKVYWQFNNNPEAPTFSPSVKHTTGKYVDPKNYPDEGDICHYFIRDGRIEFCTDCTHAFAGKNVSLAKILREEVDHA